MSAKATKIDLLNFSSVQMRAFHCTWIAFFLCFFGWFGVAPLMPVIRKDLGLNQEQIGNIMIASVAITIIARLIIGQLVDKFGPRITYTYLLIIGSLPVMLIGLSNSYETFLIYRLSIGVIGASFVLTQFHTSVMFAPNVVGTANAASAGWGNLGGGVVQMVMPMVFATFVGFGYAESVSWRLAMVVPGVLLIVMAFLYYRLTKDTPEGNFSEIHREKKEKPKGAFMEAAKDIRVWALFLVYGACFGVEITINNIASIYFTDNFGLDLKNAGFIAGLFGILNIFARAFGGILGDKAGNKWGLKGRVVFMGLVILLEGIFLTMFSLMTNLPLAVTMLLVFSLFTQMACGATFCVVPFINKKAIGAVSGIVGAGGNAGAVAAGFLFKEVAYAEGLYIVGITVALISLVSFLVRFTPAQEKEAKAELERILEEAKAGLTGAGKALKAEKEPVMEVVK
jgi:MFS transporter, NNP family, nitrate/nitrite transporter